MGQYFKAVNLDKREFVCPWCLDGGAKLWEWAVNRQGAVFTLLLRQSSQTGGGDCGGPAMQAVEVTAEDGRTLPDLIAKALAREGMDFPIPSSSVVGRWAGDRVTLVGDYDDSGLYREAESFTNISEGLVEEWNQFVVDERFHLTHEPCGCTESEET